MAKKSITTFKKAMDLIWDKAVEYNIVFKVDSFNKAV